MRLLSVILVAAAAACTGSSMGDGDGDGDGSNDLMPPERGFQITTPEITLQPGQEVTYCYYFRTPNTDPYAIKRWASKMTPGSHHMILYFTPQLSQPEGTVTASNCGILAGGSTNIPSWVYSAQTPEADMQLPADDGTGVPVGMDVPANQAAYLELHYNHKGDEPLVVSAKLNAEAYDEGVATTKTYAYVTFNGNIRIEPGATGHTETQTCNIPSTSKVWMMSTHAHQLAVKTEVRDGTEVVFESTDWEHPGARTWMTTPFYQFSTGKLTFACTYNNPTGNTVRTGDSAQTDEMCMASGYVFPATKATICYNGFILP
jgi:hypothetical protein